MENDAFGDRMKRYERQETDRFLIPLLPVIIRLDGKGFSKFTKGLNRPYDENMIKCMVETTKDLVKETNALIGYTQSDEITLLIYNDDYKKEIYFNGRIFKITSTLSSLASVSFYKKVLKYIPSHIEKSPVFDCRVWNVPNKIEAVNNFIWREKDATKNSVSMACSEYFSHDFLLNKNTSEKKKLLEDHKEIIWGNYPTHFKRGTYVRRVEELSKFTVEELDKLPLKHNARLNPELQFVRSSIKEIDMPIITTITNLEDVFFNGLEPIIKSENV